ncbi:2OG-Fe dioxygenase family protein [Methyloceanibacter marginalis]|uniref:2OG-Fe dioxygenase family protein n=1 Tax=Methyloceanibacter marginalis TaxID=1774971 RepID=UPI0009F5FD4E|nr:2OG-Fe dioxygenase family protein [Methyloceanibacter marginalis]
MSEEGSSERGVDGEGTAPGHRSSSSTKLLDAIAQDIARDGFAVRTGKEMRAIMRTRGLEAWPDFASTWDDLGIDKYMADGGRYRRRRFGTFKVTGSVVVRKNHQPHYQSRDYNILNGGIERWFMPVKEAVTDNAFAQGLVSYCAALFDMTSSMKSSVSPWHVEMHQFRIEATPDETGAPTPEGVHRDGVDWVCVMLIRRSNVASGVTQIFDRSGRPLGEFTLIDPLDAVLIDDHRVLHGVTPIAPLSSERKACRDVLVLTYRREHETASESR